MPIRIPLTPLTPASFSAFGAVIQPPSGTSASSGGESANQGTALKFPHISALENHYASSSSAPSAQPMLSLFVCQPRALRAATSGPALALSTPAAAAPATLTAGPTVLRQTVLERHPYTTQTFSPLGLDPHDARTAYVVIVAPTLATPPGSKAGPPDASAAQAFLCTGGQAVTYGAGTWHAPMIVVGQRSVSFVVAQFANGVADDDCQEWYAKDGEEIEVEIDLESLGRSAGKARL